MSSDKVMAAREWGDAIRIVSVEWLLACVREWRRVSEEGFAVKEVNEDDVETGDEELEGKEELEGREELEGNDRLKANEDDVETGSEEDSDADKDEDQVVWENSSTEVRSIPSEATSTSSHTEGHTRRRRHSNPAASSRRWRLRRQSACFCSAATPSPRTSRRPSSNWEVS